MRYTFTEAHIAEFERRVTACIIRPPWHEKVLKATNPFPDEAAARQAITKKIAEKFSNFKKDVDNKTYSFNDATALKKDFTLTKAELAKSDLGKLLIKQCAIYLGLLPAYAFLANNDSEMMAHIEVAFDHTDFLRKFTDEVIIPHAKPDKSALRAYYTSVSWFSLAKYGIFAPDKTYDEVIKALLNRKKSGGASAKTLEHFKISTALSSQ